MPVAATSNEHKAGLRLLGLLPPLQGRVVTADAMFTHRDFAQKVLDSGGTYVLTARPATGKFPPTAWSADRLRELGWPEVR